MINAINTAFSGSPQMVSLKGFRGFTLAEVLITLVIIGVIAAMTIPTLINKTNNQELVSRLNKTYSTLGQATQKIIAEEGNPNSSVGGWATSTEAVYNMYKKYLSVSKDCGYNTSGCWSAKTRTLKYQTLTKFYKNRYQFVLSDGAFISFNTGDDYNSECSRNGTGSYYVCQLIAIDVNGLKGPNEVGKDIYNLGLREDGLIPAGCDYNACRVGTDSGWGCTCKVLREGAIINY